METIKQSHYYNLVKKTVVVVVIFVACVFFCPGQKKSKFNFQNDSLSLTFILFLSLFLL